MSWFWEYELTWWYESKLLTGKGFVQAKDLVHAMKKIAAYYGEDVIEAILYLRAAQEGNVFELSEIDEKARYKVVDSRDATQSTLESNEQE